MERYLKHKLMGIVNPSGGGASEFMSVNFDGATLAIRESKNVASVTRVAGQAAGVWRITFTTPALTRNYKVVVSGPTGGATASSAVGIYPPTTPLNTYISQQLNYVDIALKNAAGAYFDSDNINCVIFS